MTWQVGWETPNDGVYSSVLVRDEDAVSFMARELVWRLEDNDLEEHELWNAYNSLIHSDRGLNWEFKVNDTIYFVRRQV